MSEGERLPLLPEAVMDELSPAALHALAEWCAEVREKYAENAYRLLLTPGDDVTRVTPARIGVNALILAWMLNIPPLHEVRLEDLKRLYGVSGVFLRAQKRALVRILRAMNPRIHSSYCKERNLV